MTRRFGYGCGRLAAVRRGSIVRITIYGVLAGIAASVVAVVVPWLPTSASKEMDRIEFTFWFTTVICIAVFAVVAAVIIYSVLNFRVQPGDESDGPPIHGHTGLEIVVDGGAGDTRDRDLDRERDRARPEQRRRPEPASHLGDRAAVRVEVRVPRRRQGRVRGARAAGRPAGEADAALTRRDPLVLGARVRPEVRRRAGDRDDARDHADEEGRVLGHLHRALRARPLDHARARPGRRPGRVREVPGRRGRRRSKGRELRRGGVRGRRLRRLSRLRARGLRRRGRAEPRHGRSAAAARWTSSCASRSKIRTPSSRRATSPA